MRGVAHPDDLSKFLTEAERLAEQGDSSSLRYACLQLRMCIERIFYRLLPLYAEFLPDRVQREWRPKPLMDAIIASDPLAAFHHVVTITPHPKPGDDEPPKPISSTQEGLRKGAPS